MTTQQQVAAAEMSTWAAFIKKMLPVNKPISKESE